MTQAATILIADDDHAVRTVLSQTLKRAGYGVEATDNAATLYQWAIEGRGDLVITDVMMPGENGLDLLARLRKRRPDMKVIVISAQNALITGVTANERGAADFLPKPFDIDELLETVKSALRKMPRAENQNKPETAGSSDRTFVVGQSRVMQDIYRTIARLRHSDLRVLITGESGTGKEVIARALHEYSNWKKGPFVAVNMAAIPRELIESELFGHEKGAFTGATQRGIGRFMQAEGGTLFLDEIGDMPYDTQTRLLRVLQEGEFTSVGGRQVHKTRVRIIAATNRDMKALVRDGAFREDLYYRLNVIPLRVPSLRERLEDIPDLVRHFSAGSNVVFDAAALALLQRNHWRGNIRELENTVKRLIAFSVSEVIDAAAVLPELATAASGMEDVNPDAISGLIDKGFADGGKDVYARVIAAVEKPLVERALQVTSGNQIRAAEILGLNRNTLRKKIRDLGIILRKGSHE